LGIGDWELRIGPNPQSPIPNPQSPIPNPQSPKYGKQNYLGYIPEKKERLCKFRKEIIFMCKKCFIKTIDILSLSAISCFDEYHKTK